MVIGSCEAWRYDLPLTAPLCLGNQCLYSRRGAIIRINADEGYYGYGEVAPFPGLHGETLETALQQFQDSRASLIGQKLPEGLPHLQGGFENWLGQYGLCASLRSGIEMAVLNLLACARQTTLAGLFSRDYCKTVPINGLWVSGDDVQEQARLLAAQGYTSVKLKVGRRTLEEDIETVRMARAALGEHFSLRLDANRCWDFESAVRFGRAVVDCHIDYIEEPLQDPALIEDFYRMTSIAVAFDESLNVCCPATLVIPLGVTAFVLKPSVLGGFEKTMEFMRLAKRCGIVSFISSAFDSGVGLAAFANIAAALCQPGVPMGFDTYRWLREDLLEIPFAAIGAQVSVDQVYNQARQLRSDCLVAV